MGSYSQSEQYPGKAGKRKLGQGPNASMDAPPGKQARQAHPASSGQISGQGPDSSSWASFSRFSLPTSQDFAASRNQAHAGPATDDYLLKLLGGSRSMQQAPAPPHMQFAMQQQPHMPLQQPAPLPSQYPTMQMQHPMFQQSMGGLSHLSRPFAASLPSWSSQIQPSALQAFPQLALQPYPMQHGLAPSSMPTASGASGQSVAVVPSSATARDRLGEQGYTQARRTMLRHQDTFMEQLHELHRIVSRQKRLMLVCEDMSRFHAEVGRLEQDQRLRDQQAASRKQQEAQYAKQRQQDQADCRMQQDMTHQAQQAQQQQLYAGYGAQAQASAGSYPAAAGFGPSGPVADPMAAWMARHYPGAGAVRNPAALLSAAALQMHNPAVAAYLQAAGLQQPQHSMLAPQQGLPAGTQQPQAQQPLQQVAKPEPQPTQPPANWWSDPRWTFGPSGLPSAAGPSGGKAGAEARSVSPMRKLQAADSPASSGLPDSQQMHPKQRHKQRHSDPPSAVGAAQHISKLAMSAAPPAALPRVQSMDTANHKTGSGISAFTAIPRKPCAPVAQPAPEPQVPVGNRCESIGSEGSKSCVEHSGGGSAATPKSVRGADAERRHSSGELSGSKPRSPAVQPQTAAAAGLLLSLSRPSHRKAAA